MSTPTAADVRLARIAEIRRDSSNYADVETASVAIHANLFRDGVLVDGEGTVLELVNGVEEIARLEKALATPTDEPMPNDEIDTFNRFLVATRGTGIIVMNPPLREILSTDAALNLAAYLVTLADDGSGLWERTLSAVQST